MEIISKHLDKTQIDNVQDVDTVCAFTGQKITKGIHKKHAIKKTFTDIAYLKYPSDYVGMDVAATMSNIIKTENGQSSLRNYSFIANSERLVLLRNSDVMKYILKPLEPPFQFCISFNNKKHLAFKSKVNYNGRKYIITTDFGDCEIDIDKVNEVLPSIQDRYSVIPAKSDTKAKPTWFTKDEILNGCRNYKKIEQYGERYFEQEKIIQKYRGTMLLKILINSLTKSDDNVKTQL